LKLEEIAYLRLRNQRVSGARFKSAEEIVGWLGAVQSQEYPLAKWTLGMRADGLRDADVDAALRNGRILRTHILRPTWHFVLPADIRWMMTLTAPRIARLIRTAVGLTVPPESEIQRALEVFRSVLANGRRLTRQQLVATLVEHGFKSQQQTVPILIRAELDLVICSGGLIGKAQSYALVDELAPVPRGWVFDRDWALVELTRRYFTSHGPATVPDFSWWSGLTVADARRGIEANSAGLQRVEVDGEAYWWAGDVSGMAPAGGSAGGSADESPTVHLMQGYDEYIVAYKSPRRPINVSGLVPGAALNRPPFLHAVILDTQLIGWWRRVTTKDGYAIETQLVRPLNAPESKALHASVDRYADFVGQPVTLLS
jgi:hypothetical protein